MEEEGALSEALERWNRFIIPLSFDTRVRRSVRARSLPSFPSFALEALFFHRAATKRKKESVSETPTYLERVTAGRRAVRGLGAGAPSASRPQNYATFPVPDLDVQQSSTDGEHVSLYSSPEDSRSCTPKPRHQSHPRLNCHGVAGARRRLL